jgi:hypothetical protein
MGAAAELVESGVQETLTYYTFPDIHWQKIRTNNPLNAFGLSPSFHPAMGRIPVLYEPIGLGGATGRGAEPSA